MANKWTVINDEYVCVKGPAEGWKVRAARGENWPAEMPIHWAYVDPDGRSVGYRNSSEQAKRAAATVARTGNDF